MNLIELDQLLDDTPVIAHMHPVSLVYLDKPVKVYSTVREMALALDTTTNLPLERWLTFDANPHYLRRFPEVFCDHSPFTKDLNQVLLKHYDWIGQQMLNQSLIAGRIVSEADGFDTIILILLDGLSFADCLEWPKVEPCLAVLPTITRICFPAIVNDPPIASRLFIKGFERRIGCTYWNREDNKLTNQLFRTIRDIRIIQNWNEGIVDWLRHDNNLRQTYIQIVRSGLDDYADGVRVAAPRVAIVHELWQDILAVADTLREHEIRARIYVTADHGLLWKGQGFFFDVLARERGSLRYGPTKPVGSRGRWGQIDGERIWILDYPQLRRNLHVNEQGTHGGISFEECVTPFVTMEV